MKSNDSDTPDSSKAVRTRNENKYTQLFEKAPIGLIEFSADKLYRRYEELIGSGWDSIKNYFNSEESRIEDFLDLIEFNEINEKTLQITDSPSQKYFRENFLQLLTDVSHEPLISITIEFFSEGEVEVEKEIQFETFEDKAKWAELSIVDVDPDVDGFPEILMSINDVTERKKKQREISRREGDFRSLVSNVPGIVYRCDYDEDWTMRYMSETAQDITGYNSEDFINNNQRTFSSIIHPSDREKVLKTVEDSVENRDEFEVEYRIVRKDDEIVWVHERGQPVFGENGVDYLQGVILDVTQRKKYENELRQSEERFRHTFEQAAVGILHVDPDGSFIRVNQKSCELLGYTEEELLEKTFQELTHPDDLKNDLKNVQKLLDDEIDHYSIEKRYFQKNNDIIWANLTVSLVRNELGEPQYFVSVIEDITDRKSMENNLRKSERKFRQLVEATDHVFWIFDLSEEELRYISPGLEDTLGIDKELIDDFPGDLFDYVHPEDREVIRSTLPAPPESVSTIEFRLCPPDGDVRWIRDKAYPYNDDTGNQLIAGIYENITKRKKAENELRRSEEKFNQISENIDHVIWLRNPHNETFDHVSPAFEDIWGRPVDDLLEEPEVWYESIHPEDRDWLGQTLKSDQMQGGYDERYRIIRDDGSIRWIEDRAFPIENKNGEIERIAGVAEDITERVRIQEEKETFFDLTLDLFVIADYQGKFLEINQAMIDILGYSKEKLLNNSYLKFIHPDDREHTNEVIKKLNQGEKIVSFENRYLTDDGEYRWLDWRAQPGDEMIYAVARDVTERREFEERLQDMISEKETLLEEIHHRVKNNLQIISSLLNMQKRKIGQPEADRALSESIQRINSMALIHEQLYGSEKLSNIDFEDYLRNLVDRLLTLQLQTGRDVDVDISVDESELDLQLAIPCGLILNELINNSFEHGGQDNGLSQIDVHFHRTKDGFHELVVEDDGQGFPQDFNFDTTESMGMKVIQSLAEYELNGDVEIDNNHGAKVKITFPHLDVKNDR